MRVCVEGGVEGGERGRKGVRIREGVRGDPPDAVGIGQLERVCSNKRGEGRE